jgi:DNA mismatch endonuclease (patch repair protein)
MPRAVLPSRQAAMPTPNANSDTRKSPSYKGLKPSSAAASSAARACSRKSDTRCEVILRSLLWRTGARFRKNVKTLPGKPDIVFPTQRLAVFCDGDFWHGRNWEARREKLARGSNAHYWTTKIARNRERDQRNTRQLESQGWTVLRLWESDIHHAPEAAKERVLRTLAGLDKNRGMA